MLRTATFCNLPVSTNFDRRVACSCASLHWVLNSGLRTYSPNLSGPLTLPCHNGVLSMDLHNIPVNVSPTYDLVLGLDWPNDVQHYASQPIVYLSSKTINSTVTEPCTGACQWLRLFW